MLDKFRTLLGHTLIYGLGNYGIKVIGFLLIPLYTRYLAPSDYGVMALVSMYTQAMFVCMNLGQTVSLFRHYYDHDTQEGRERVVAASLWIVFLFALPLASIPLFFPEWLAGWLLGDESLWVLMWIGTGTVLAKVLLRMPFQIMRAEGRSKHYAKWSLLRNALSTGFAVVFVAWFLMGAHGVVLSQFVGEIIMCSLLVGGTLKMLRAGFHWPDVKAQLLFGLPLVPAGVATFCLDLTDRWFLKEFYSVDEVGIYSLGYRFGEILTFVVTAFQLSWPQFLFSNRQDENAPQIYSQMTGYYVGVMVFMWLGLSAFAPELILIMATPSYYAAATVVPVIALAMAFEGMAFMFNVGQLFLKKTIFRPVTVIGAALVNLLFNWLLIPEYGMLGAAWATLLGFFAAALITLGISQWLYPIPYQYGKMFGAAGLGLGLYVLGLIASLDNVYLSLLVKAGIVALYPGLLLAIGYFEPEDVGHGFAFVERKWPKAAPVTRALRTVLPNSVILDPAAPETTAAEAATDDSDTPA